MIIFLNVAPYQLLGYLNLGFLESETSGKMEFQEPQPNTPPWTPNQIRNYRVSLTLCALVWHSTDRMVGQGQVHVRW